MVRFPDAIVVARKAKLLHDASVLAAEETAERAATAELAAREVKDAMRTLFQHLCNQSAAASRSSVQHKTAMETALRGHADAQHECAALRREAKRWAQTSKLLEEEAVGRAAIGREEALNVASRLAQSLDRLARAASRAGQAEALATTDARTVQAELAHAVAEHTALATSSKQAAEAARKELASAAQVAERTRTEVANAKRAGDDARHELQQLKKSTDEASATWAAERTTLSAQQTELRERVAAAEQRLITMAGDAERARLETTNAQRQLAEAVKSASEEKKAAELATISSNRSATQTRNELEARLADTGTQLSKATAAAAVQETAARQLQEQLVEARRDLSRQRDAHKGLEDELALERERLKAAQLAAAGTVSASVKAVEHEATIRRLTTDLAAARARSDELAADLQKQVIETASARSEALAGATREKEKLQRELHALQLKMQETTADHAQERARGDGLERALAQARAQFADQADVVKHREALAQEKFNSALHAQQQATAAEQRAANDRLIARMSHDDAAHDRRIAESAQIAAYHIGAEQQREAAMSSRALLVQGSNNDGTAPSDGQLFDVRSFTEALVSGSKGATPAAVADIASTILKNLLSRNISLPAIVQQFCRAAGTAGLTQAKAAFIEDKKQSAMCATALGVVTTVALRAAAKSGDAQSARVACDLSSQLTEAAAQIAGAAQHEPNIDPQNTIASVARECELQAAKAPKSYEVTQEYRDRFMHECQTTTFTPEWSTDVFSRMQRDNIPPNVIIRDFCGPSTKFFDGEAHKLLGAGNYDAALLQLQHMTAANAVAVAAVDALKRSGAELDEMCAEAVRTASTNIEALTARLKRAAGSGSQFNHALGETVASFGEQVGSAAQRLVPAPPAASSPLSAVNDDPSGHVVLATPQLLKTLEAKQITQTQATAAAGVAQYVQRPRGRAAPGSLPEPVHQDFVQARAF